MPVGGSNALKSKAFKPRGARSKLGCPASNLDRVTTTTRTVPSSRVDGASPKSPPNPIEVSVRVRVGLEERKPGRPRGQERDKIQGVERRVIGIPLNEEARRTKESTDIQRKLDLPKQEKSPILTTPLCDVGGTNQPSNRQYEARGRRKRGVKQQIISKVEKKPQPNLRPTDFSEVQARRVHGVEKIPERTIPPDQAEILRGRRKRVPVRPVVCRPQKTTAVNNNQLEKIISNLYDTKCALKMGDISKKAMFIKTVVEKEIIMKISELDDRFTFDILRAGK